MNKASTSAAGRPFKKRLLASPIRDIIRGRTTGRLDLKIYPERAALPKALADLVVRVAKKTRLHALEKADVARELTAHFAEGIAKGKMTDELIDSFGDVREAVKLIRRAKKRNRNRALRIATRTAAGAFALIAILYGGVLIWYVFASGKINPSHDYVADLNASATAVTEQDRAWPVYREAFLALGEIPEYVKVCEGPADHRWVSTAAYLSAHQPELEQIRRGAAMPGLGYIARIGFSKADLPLLDPKGQFTNTFVDGGLPGMIPMFGASLPQLSYLLKAERLLRFDALRQIEIGSAADAISDFRAMVGLARHAGEQNLLISQLVRIRVHANTVRTAKQLLERLGESLTDEDLAALDNLFNPAIVGDLYAVSTGGERLMLLDTEQHIYTDKGHGNGRLHPKMLVGFEDYSPSFGGAPLVFAAPISAVMPDRKAFHAQGDLFYDAMDRENERPMWERDVSEMQMMIDRIEESSWEQIRWSYLLMFIPGFEKIITISDTAAMERDALRAAIALFRYKLVTHNWPADLEALVGVFMDAPPIDRFDGEPLRYKLDADGQPVLYSIGADLDDDAGVAALDKDGWPTLAGVQRWRPPSQVAKIKAAATSDGHWSSDRLARGDYILWPPLPEKPAEVEEDVDAPLGAESDAAINAEPDVESGAEQHASGVSD